MKRLLILSLALAGPALAGCASELQSDLGTAEAPCHHQAFTDKTGLVQCLAAAERPVWAKDEPQTLDLYDRFAAGRIALAQGRDAGTVSEKDYDTRLDALTQDLRRQIAQRREVAKSPD